MLKNYRNYVLGNLFRSVVMFLEELICCDFELVEKIDIVICH